MAARKRKVDPELLLQFTDVASKLVKQGYTIKSWAPGVTPEEFDAHVVMELADDSARLHYLLGTALEDIDDVNQNQVAKKFAIWQGSLQLLLDRLGEALSDFRDKHEIDCGVNAVHTP